MDKYVGTPCDRAYRIEVLLLIQGAQVLAPVSKDAMVALVESLIESIVECDTEPSA